MLALLFALLLTAVSVTMILRAAAAPRSRAAATLAQIGAYGFRSATEEKAPGSMIDSLAGTFGRILAVRLSGFRESEVRRELVAAGLYSLEPKKFLGYQGLAALTAFLGMLAIASRGSLSPLVLVAAVVVAPLAGWIAPRFLVRKRAQRRLAEIDYTLPELIDLIVVAVEAGLGFVGALRVASERLEGPLGEELRLTLQEQAMGLSSNEALRNMLERSDTPAVRSFVRSIVQGQTLGASIGQIMRNLALEMRKRRRQKAEERAQKAPVKILFPLIFLIFPSMFVILLGPAVFSFLEAFGD